MPDLYPEIEPYDQGMLDAGDGNQIYWEVSGNPQGKPVVNLHGGPGSGHGPGGRRFFDPDAYRIVLFDQRQCGRSRPHASDPATDLRTNTTDHLIADIERLRQHLGIDRWLVFGGSWGTTLALAYAQRHPERVTEMVLFGVSMTRPSETAWLYYGLRHIFPAEWARFRSGAPPDARDDDLVEAYYHLLHDPDPMVREQAARDWCDWEGAIVSVDPNHRPSARYDDPRFRMAFARIVTHYFRHHAWLEDGELLRNIGRLAGIPCVMVHGRLDFGTPLLTPWELHQAWPGSELIVVPYAGHNLTDAGMVEALVAATDRFARRP